MNRHVRHILSHLLLAGLVTIFALSCTSSDDAGTPTGPFIRDGIPLLPAPTLRITPELATTDSLARYAKGRVVGQFNRVRLAAKTAEAICLAINSGPWSRTETGCRTRQTGESEDALCTHRLQACATATGFDWLEVLNGACIPDTGVAPFVDWVRFAGSSNADGSAGFIETFIENTSLVEESFTWQTDPNRKVREWSLYDGPATEANLEGRLRWEESDNGGAAGEYLWDPNHRWEAEILSNGREGTMTLLERNRESGLWVRREDISWVPAHGSWSFFDPDGALVEERTW